MKKSHFILLFFLLLISTSCQNEEVSYCDLAEVDCVDLPEQPFEWSKYELIMHKSPCFNPNNSNEFVYQLEDYENQLFQLIKYNIKTSEKKILLNGVKVYSQPQWGKNGWIVFDSEDFKLFLLHQSGDSLICFHNESLNIYPVWNDQTEEVIWHCKTDYSYYKVFGLKKKINQEIPDTLFELPIYRSDVFDNKLIKKNDIDEHQFLGYLKITDNLPLSLNSFVPITSEVNGYTNGICWSSDGNSIFISNSSKSSGLFKVTLDGKVKKIVEYCQSKRYQNISASSDGKYLIGELISKKLECNEEENYTGMIEKSSIFLIDLENHEEIKVHIE
jgi:hypothetical protein